ncbi:LLM class flavin-dependent oxidoreductase (plasmid) [Rhodococcus oxybenzonivorans]|uniref:LLM class flavin-dependent oxidoreductase n=1 Tax=Rhodococcus oxybenzonivorans TaxID=1990687 RepID=A0A2S2C605_9NOCA|nr:LLM class flavin-dependent oxidoreductase [Rhodococcus oxybenzonivorans]AWK76295.1 LLM class flavin-dependent oxidoreductase [Rhodococcus oxybenzonivorans]
MKFGLFAMPNHLPHENWTLSYDWHIAEIVKAEELGFDEYWIGEHHTGGRENVPSPELLLAKASALTSRIRLGTGVVSLPYQDPFLVAERMAFLDHLTHGRLEYGFGGGGLPTDRALFEVPAEEARARTDEALEIVWKFLTSDDPVSYDGKYWTYKERRIQVAPYQDVPPFAVAGLTGTHNYAKCGERGWKSMSTFISPVNTDKNPAAPDLRAHAEAMCNAAQEAGRDPAQARENWRISREVYVSDSKDQAIKEIRQNAEEFYKGYLFPLGISGILKTDENMADADLTVEWMIENSPWIIGSPEDCVRQINELNEQVGGFGTLLINSAGWVTMDRWTRSLELFSRYVAPHFQPNQRIQRRLESQADLFSFGESARKG